MPYANEHAARLRDPGDFRPDTFRRKDIASGVSLVMGKLKDGGNEMIPQAYRFDAEEFTPAEAKAWLAEHGVEILSFEEATGAKENAAQALESLGPQGRAWLLDHGFLERWPALGEEQRCLAVRAGVRAMEASGGVIVREDLATVEYVREQLGDVLRPFIATVDSVSDRLAALAAGEPTKTGAPATGAGSASGGGAVA